MPINAINQASLRLLLPMSPEETYKVILEEACKLVNAFRGSLFLADNGTLVRVYSTVPLMDQFDPRPDGRVYDVFHNQQTLVLSARALKRERVGVIADSGTLFVYIPLGFAMEAMGVITLEVKDRDTFSDRWLAGLKLFGSFASLKIKNAHLLAKSQEALELRDLFISMASHELKTPLTTISGYAQLLSRQVESGQAVNKSWVKAVRNEAKRLKILVQELLTVDQIKAETFVYHFQKKDIKTVITHAIDDLGFTYPRHPISFYDHVPDNELLVPMDDNKILQVLINVLNNAAKFSDPGQPINLSLGIEQKKAIIKVKDKGEGISERDLKRVFRALYHGKDTAREGMGMGLYIVKNIVDAHKGIVHIDSQKKQGTEVVVALPLG